MIILSILLPIDKYSVEEATDWVRTNGYIVRKIHTTKGYHRFRQHTTKYAKDRGCDNIRTISLGNSVGVQFIVSYCDEQTQGGGIYDTAKSVIFGRSRYAPSQQMLIDRYGNETITYIRIGRSPLPSFINKALDILTFGKFKSMLKKYSYDRLYHLFMIVSLSNGVKILVEKNSGINITQVSNYDPKNTEYVDATYIPSGLTFKELLDNGQQVLGNKYFPYDATKSNCQQYIIGLLKGSSILTKQLQDFVYQDVASLFKDYQTALGLVKGITDIGSTIDIIQKGGIIDKEEELQGGIIPPFARYGGKSRIAKRLIEMFPNPKDYDIYVEPFLGAGNVFLSKDKDGHKEVINDLDKNVYTIFKQLQKNAKYINDRVKRNNVTKSEWLKLNKSNDPADIITSIKWSFMGMNRYWSGHHQIKTDYLQYQERLHGVTILNKSFETVIKKYDSPKTFFYLDPPYNTKSKSIEDYGTPIITPLDIYTTVKDVKGYVMISYNNDTEMKQLFKDWNIRYIDTKYSNNFNLREKDDKLQKIVKELVITNY
jgi:DNA adenine methylase